MVIFQNLPHKSLLYILVVIELVSLVLVLQLEPHLHPLPVFVG
jgi:hypothetical protein